MPTPSLIAAALILVLVALNVYATLRVVRDKLSERWQKVAQTVLVWALPLVGAILVLYLHRNERFERREYQINPNDQFAGGDP